MTEGWLFTRQFNRNTNRKRKTKMSVHKKLMQARIKLQSTTLTKSGQNKFAGYAYFELGDFIPAVNNIFSDLGLCGTVSFGSELATLTIRDVDSDSELVITSPMSTAALKGCHDVQNLGAVQTYLRRYLWVAALEIVEHDALDAGTGKEEPEKKKPELKQVPTPEHKKLAQLRKSAQHGLADLQSAWQALSKEDRQELQDELPKLKIIAQEWAEALAVQA